MKAALFYPGAKGHTGSMALPAAAAARCTSPRTPNSSSMRKTQNAAKPSPQPRQGQPHRRPKAQRRALGLHRHGAGGDRAGALSPTGLGAKALAPKEGKGLHTCNPKGCLQQERPPPEMALGPLLRVQESSSWEKGRDRVYR